MYSEVWLQRLPWALSGIGFLVAVVMALAARGLAGDEEVGHFLIARYAPEHPELFMSTYGRPVVTIWFSLPSQAGLWVARLAAAVLAGLTTLAVVRITQPTRWYHTAFVIPCLFLQPYYLAHTATVMTEPVAAGLVAWGLLAYAERRLLMLALIAGLLPVARQEWIIFWPILALVFIRERRWFLLGLIPLPMFLWATAGALRYGDPLWIVRQFGWRDYTPRDVLHYVKSLAWIIGVGLLVPVMIGLARAVWTSITKQTRVGQEDPGQRALVVSALIVFTMIPVYTYFAVWHPITFGMHRFFAGLAAPIAILAIAGLGWFARGNKIPVWGALAVTLAGSTFLWNHPVHSDMSILARTYWLPIGVTLTWGVLTGRA